MAIWDASVGAAIQHQLYRRVAIDQLTTAGELPLPPAGGAETPETVSGGAQHKRSRRTRSS